MCWRGVDFHSKRPRSVWQPVKVIVAEPSRSEPFSAPNATLSPSCQIASLSADSAAPVIVSGGGETFPRPFYIITPRRFALSAETNKTSGFQLFTTRRDVKRKGMTHFVRDGKQQWLLYESFYLTGTGKKNLDVLRAWYERTCNKKKQHYYTRTKNEVFIAFQ